MIPLTGGSTPSAQSAPGEFAGPAAVACDRAGNVYVADGYNHRVQQFTPHGELLATWGRHGTGDGEFRYVAGIAVD
ncbi:MAG TPA: hypothetical protein VFX49_01230 [Chloroflexota bacterium]|nr:hypothetical protein [Chloroflexota bacterium]